MTKKTLTDVQFGTHIGPRSLRNHMILPIFNQCLSNMFINSKNLYKSNIEFLESLADLIIYIRSNARHLKESLNIIMFVLMLATERNLRVLSIYDSSNKERNEHKFLQEIISKFIETISNESKFFKIMSKEFILLYLLLIDMTIFPQRINSINQKSLNLVNKMSTLDQDIYLTLSNLIISNQNLYSHSYEIPSIKFSSIVKNCLNLVELKNSELRNRFLNYVISLDKINSDYDYLKLQIILYLCVIYNTFDVAISVLNTVFTVKSNVRTINEIKLNTLEIQYIENLMNGCNDEALVDKKIQYQYSMQYRISFLKKKIEQNLNLYLKSNYIMNESILNIIFNPVAILNEKVLFSLFENSNNMFINFNFFDFEAKCEIFFKTLNNIICPTPRTMFALLLMLNVFNVEQLEKLIDNIDKKLNLVQENLDILDYILFSKHKRFKNFIYLLTLSIIGLFLSKNFVKFINLFLDKIFIESEEQKQNFDESFDRNLLQDLFWNKLKEIVIYKSKENCKGNLLPFDDMWEKEISIFGKTILCRSHIDILVEFYIHQVSL